MTNKSDLEDELAANIGKARKQVTVLFTDIVDSSRYWDQFGDVKGRMMMDLHNRLVFPVIKKFKGRIIKTIGDGLMAAFKRPSDALNAGIGIQQILRKMRDADRSFNAKVRIGLHTGMAIVEEKDVYGDVVNVASRVEGFGEANEIVLSSATAELLKDGKHAFHRKGSFIPKGKREPMTVYRCRWNEYKDLSRGLKVSADFPLDAREKGDIVAYGVIIMAVVVIMYHTYLRYIIASFGPVSESPQAQILTLNPLLLFSHYSFVLPIFTAILLALLLVLMWLKTAPYLLLRILKGFMGFSLGFLLLYVPIHYFEVGFATGKDQEVFRTSQRFMTVQYQHADKVLDLSISDRNWHAFYDKEIIVPAVKGAKVTRRLAVKADADLSRGNTEKQVGVWTIKNLSAQTPKLFYFRLLDLCAISLGVLGFFSGFMNFTIRPS